VNYLFRPTPVAVLGRDRGQDTVPLVKSPAGMMGGSPHASSHPSRSLATQGAPWLVRSGTMASFGTLGNVPGGWSPTGDAWYPYLTRMDALWPGRRCTGLGQADIPMDVSSGIDFSTIDIPDTGSGFDYSTLPPNLPIEALPAVPTPPPDIFGAGVPIPPGGLPPFLPVPYAAPPSLAPAGGAGPTGRSIPGTQPVNPMPAISAGTGLLTSIANFFKPTTAAASTVRLPGVGVNPNIPAPSFWTTSSILPGTPNSTVVLGGAAIVVLLIVLGMGGKSGR